MAEKYEIVENPTIGEEYFYIPNPRYPDKYESGVYLERALPFNNGIKPYTSKEPAKFIGSDSVDKVYKKIGGGGSNRNQENENQKEIKRENENVLVHLEEIIKGDNCKIYI